MTKPKDAIGNLCLTRRCGETIVLNDGNTTITVTVNRVRNGQASLLIKAPRSFNIAREELLEKGNSVSK